MKKALCLLCALVWPVAASAANWMPLGPYGAEARAVVTNPRSPSEVYVLAYGNPAQVFRSADGGASWARVSMVNDVLHDLIIHPASGALYALAGGAVYKSLNRGQTWTSYALDTRDSGYSGALAGHPTNPDLVYAAGLHRPAESHSHMAFFKSANGGKTWSMTPLQANSSYGYLTKLAVSPKSPNVILAAGYFSDDSQTLQYRIFKSANGGKTWADKTGVISGAIRDVAAHPTNPKVFYAATDTNIWRTSNGAATWKKNNGYALGYSVVVDPAQPTVLYAGHESEVFRSLNGGLDWETASAGLYGGVWDFSFPTGKVLCGTSADVFACAGGAWPAWTASSKGMKAANTAAVAVAPSSPRNIYAAVFGYGIFRSKNTGVAWELLPGPVFGNYVSRLAVHPKLPDVAYALSDIWGPDSFYVTNDAGRTWTELLSDHGEDFVLGPKDARAIFIAGQVSAGGDLVLGLHLSADAGATWTHTAASSVPGSCAYAVAVDPKNDAVIYLGGESDGKAALFKSATRGAVWTNITGALTGRVQDIAVDPKNPKRIHVATDFGLWKSENGGASWTKTLPVFALAILVHPLTPNTVLAATSEGMKISKTYGRTWADFNQGLRTSGIAGVDFAVKTKTLFAATSGSSVWKRKL